MQMARRRAEYPAVVINCGCKAGRNWLYYRKHRQQVLRGTMPAARKYADMAELADAPDLGSGVYDVQVQVLLSA